MLTSPPLLPAVGWPLYTRLKIVLALLPTPGGWQPVSPEVLGLQSQPFLCNGDVDNNTSTLDLSLLSLTKNIITFLYSWPAEMFQCEEEGSQGRIYLETNGKQHETRTGWGWLHNLWLIITGKYAQTHTPRRIEKQAGSSISPLERRNYLKLNRNKTEGQGSYLLLWLLISVSK